MALISGTFPSMATGRLAIGGVILPAGRPVMLGYLAVPHLVGYYHPTATHCLVLAPAARGAEPATPRGSAGLVLAPRTGSARVEGP